MRKISGGSKKYKIDKQCPKESILRSSNSLLKVLFYSGQHSRKVVFQILTYTFYGFSSEFFSILFKTIKNKKVQNVQGVV